MSKTTYTELLKGAFKPLGHYSDELIAADTDREFFRIIAAYIVPLIHQSKAFESFYFQCIKEKDAYFNRKSELETAAATEVERAYLSLKQVIKESDLSLRQQIKEQMGAIEHLLNRKHANDVPLYFHDMYCGIGYLLELMIDYDVIDKLKQFAIIDYDAAKKPYIKNLKFAPALLELNELENILRLNADKPLWAVWEELYLVEWCWATPFSFFADKDNNVNFQLLVLHSHWCEINRLKSSERFSTVFFRREKFISYLKLIINAFILSQEINGTLTSCIVDDGPYSVELKMDYTRLLLFARWFVGGNEYCYVVQSFQDGSGPHLFIDELIKVPVGQEVKIPLDKVSGGSVTKYLDGMKLNKFLRRLFFGKIKTRSARMKTKCIMGDELAILDRDELKKIIKTFKLLPDRV